MNYLTNINLDMVMSDPLLLTGAILLIVGPAIFLISLWKFLTYQPENKFIVPQEEVMETPPAVVEEESVHEITPPPPAPEHHAEVPVKKFDSDQTVVLPTGIAETQAQMEIVFAQIKQLNKRVNEMQDKLDRSSESLSAKSSTTGDGDMTAVTNDLTQKVLKLAEHIVIIEQEVERLRGASDAPSPNRPPVMPL